MGCRFRKVFRLQARKFGRRLVDLVVGIVDFSGGANGKGEGNYGEQYFYRHILLYE